MNPLRNAYGVTFLLASTMFFTGCASTGPSDAALSGDPVAMWEDGQKEVTRGEKLVKSGDTRLAEGRKQVREGEALIDSGNAGTLRARQDYQDLALLTGKANSPDEVAKETKRLKAIGKRWEEAIDDIKDGNKLVSKGNKSIDRGQAEIREGRMLMDAGSTMMRNSQRTRIGEDLLPIPELINQD